MPEISKKPKPKQENLMDLNEAIQLIEANFDGYYECMEYRKRGDKKLYPKDTMKTDKKALIEKVKEWEYKAKCWEEYKSMVYKQINTEPRILIQNIEQKINEREIE